MPLSDLAGKLLVPTRDAEAYRYTQDVLIRNPNADVGASSQPNLDGQVLADQTAVQYYNATVIANDSTRQTRTGKQLDNGDGVELGLPREGAIGASGAVVISAGPSGTTIVAGDVCVINGFKFRCVATALYPDGTPVSITGIDTGPGTNQDPGTNGVWSAPRPGCNRNVTVYKQSNGSGLSGGADIESDADYIVRLDARAANPPASGNDAEYQALTETTPAIAVQQAFTFPGIQGTGSTCVIATLRRSQPGANRIMNPTQIAALPAWVAAQLPADDGSYWGLIVPNPINVNVTISWATGAAGWADAQPWPPYIGGGGEVSVDGTQPRTPTSFYLTGNNGSNPVPVPGQSIGMFDLSALKFHRKKILTVVASGTDWIITVDTTIGTSDTSYTPAAGQVVCPWSDSLQSIVTPVVSYFDSVGPGEQLADADFIDPGLRQRRSPPNQEAFPSSLTNKGLVDAFNVSSVGDVIVKDPAIPYDCPIGSPGVFSYMTTLSNLAAFQEV